MILFGIIEIHGGDGVIDPLLKIDAFAENFYIDDIYLTVTPLTEEEEIAAVFTQSLNEIQDITISLPCGQRNLTDTITTVNSLGTNLKHSSITEEVKTMLLNNITSSLPETTTINNINFIDYK